MNREAQLTQVFVELADTLVADFDVVDVLTTLTRECVALFDIDAAGLMLVDPQGHLRLVAASDEQSQLLELFELQHEEGPCLDCYRSGEPVAISDLEGTDGWPAFRREVLACGFRSVQALPLRLRGQVVGALNLFRRRSGVLEGTSRTVCQAMADIATIGLLQQRATREAQLLADQLSAALRNRVAVEQAKGVVAAQGEIDMDVAFRLLRGYARHANRRLVDVAQDVAERRIDLIAEARAHQA